MTLFDPYSHTRVQELRQEQLARKARLSEKIGAGALTKGAGETRTGNRVSAVVARITGRRSQRPCLPAGSARAALDS